MNAWGFVLLFVFAAAGWWTAVYWWLETDHHRYLAYRFKRELDEARMNTNAVDRALAEGLAAFVDMPPDLRAARPGMPGRVWIRIDP